MKLVDFIPPVVTQGYSAWKKSFASSAAAWIRGDDVTDAPAARYSAPYQQSTAIFAAINLVSGEFTGLPLKFYEGDQEYVDPALAAWWERPCLGNDGKRLTHGEADRLRALHLLDQGEFFMLLDDSWALAGLKRRPASLSPFIIARPDRVRLITHGAQLAGYEWTDAGGRSHVYLPEQVIHKMEPNPYDDWRGLGRSQVARVPAEGVFLTGVYIRDLMRNNGDQGFIVIGKNGVATPEQQAQITAALRMKRLALRSGVAKDLFLTGDIAVDRPKEQAAGVDLTNTKTLSQQEIFLVFGVPPSMSTVKQSYSMGKDSDRYQLITGASQPVARLIAGADADLASRMTGRALTAEHDWDEHPVMQAVRRERIEAALKLWASGWCWMDINAYLDLGMTPFPGWDIAYLPFSVAPIDLAGTKVARDPVADPALAEQSRLRALPEDPAISQLRMLLAVKTRTRAKVERSEAIALRVETEALAVFTCNCGRGCIAQKADRPPGEIAQWRTLMTARRETLKSFESAFTRVLMKARIETLRKIEGAEGKAATGAIAPGVKKAAATDLLFDLAKFTASMRDALEKQHKTGLQKAGDQLFKELDREDPFTMAPAKVVEFLRGRENKLKDVPQSIYDRLKESIEAGLQAGETQAELTGRVKAEFNDIGTADARRIAQSETGAVYGAGRQAAMKDAGVQFKMWLTSGNDNVRPAHADANRQTVPVDEPFVIDGEELMHPGDDAGSAGNTINCHCASIAVATPDES